MTTVALADIPGLGPRDINTIALSEVLVLFAGLGNNCEFGIVRRHNGCDAPGLFLNVGFLSPDAMINAIDRALDGMFDEGNFEFCLPEGWPDWRLDCKIYGMGFHTAIPSSLPRGSDEWTLQTRKSIASHRYLKQKCVEDLHSGDKILVFRHNLDSSAETINRLHAAIRKHGESWLLYVVEDPGRTSGWLEMRGPGLAVAGMRKLTNENPPIVDFPAWETMIRRCAALRWQTEASPATVCVAPPRPYLEVITHVLNAGTTLQKPIFHVTMSGLQPGQLYEFEVWIYIPSGFTGTNISLVMWGAYSEDYDNVDLAVRESWQRAFVKARAGVDGGHLAPSLLAESRERSIFYTSDWRLVRVDEISPPESSEVDSEILGYGYNNGGLNNQKGALSGLVAAAFATKRPMFLPDMYNLDHAHGQSGPVPFDEIYDTGRLRQFADKYGIRIVRRPPAFRSDDMHGWSFFSGNPEYQTPPELSIELAKCLIPRIRDTDAFRTLADTVFATHGARIALQLRIEKDWTHHATNLLRQQIHEAEDYHIPYPAIFAKIHKTLGHISKTIYVICDEAGLPCPADEIRAAVKADFGFDLLWKSDFLTPPPDGNLLSLELSVLDFEMAVQAEYFVGLTRSTFSNKACRERYCRTGINVDTHYIYNNPGADLGLRTDNGVFPDPARAMSVRM